jgi:hypothetical protein
MTHAQPRQPDGEPTDVAGTATVCGLAARKQPVVRRSARYPRHAGVLLIHRRRTVGPVFSDTTRTDKAMYLVLATVVGLGLLNTVVRGSQP